MSRIPNQPPPKEKPDSNAGGSGFQRNPEFTKDLQSKNINPVNSPKPVVSQVREHRSEPSQKKEGQDIVLSMIREIYEEAAASEEETPDLSTQQKEEGIEAKRLELYKALDHLDEALVGKSLSEATAVFSSLLTIQSQLCLQKTEGITLVRSHISNFFPSFAGKANNTEMRQVVVLIFSPAEISAIRKRLSEMKENDALKPFFTTILDQSFDVVRFNEMTGWLLLEMSNYFILKVKEVGYGATIQSRRFQERYDRSRKAFEKSVRELRDMENIIQWHMRERPVLEEMPRLLRALLQIRLGVSASINPNKIVARIAALANDYNRARKTCAFDFNRLPSFQHELHLRHSNILHLQKDVLEYSAVILEQDLYELQNKLDRLLAEIEANSENLKSGDPEYEEKMNAKSALMKKLEEYRRKVNLVKCQEQMVEVQQQLIQESIKNYNKKTWYDPDSEEGIPRRVKIDKSKLRQSSEPQDEDDDGEMSSMQVRTRK